MRTIDVSNNRSKVALLSLLLPLAGLYSSVVESCPIGIAYQNCSDCHDATGTFNYSAAWSSTPTVIERNSTDTVTFSMNRNNGTVAGEGGFSALTTLGTFTATGGETNISSTNVSHSTPSAALSWSFTFNSGATSGTANFSAYGNPVNGNRAATDNNSSLCGGANANTGTSGDGNGGVFPASNTSIIVNDRPVIVAGVSNASFVENGSVTTVAPSLNLSDTENTATEIQSGSATITANYNAGDGDRLNINGATCAANSLICTGSGTRTITITGGSESALEFRNVFRAITFNNTSDTPSTSARTVEFSVTDQFSRARSDTRNVTVTTFEDPANFDTPAYNRIGTGTSSSTTQSVVEDILIQLQFAATDPEGVSTNYSLVSTTPLLTGPEPLIVVSGSGLLTWTPDGTRTSVTAIVGVNDNVGGMPDNTFSITLNVIGVNDPPIIMEGLSTSVNIDEDNAPTSFALTLNASDLDGDAIQWNIDTQGSKGLAFTSSGSGNSKVIGYLPSANEFGVDSFIVRATDGIEQDTIQVDVVIAAVNDAPLIIAVGAQAGTEGSLLTITPLVTDVDDINNGTDITWSFVSGQQAGMAISNTGVITWIPPLGAPPAIFGQSYPIAIRAADDGSDGAAAADESFIITINPPDTDNDLVADYDDLCLTVSDATNADNDGDGTAGSDGGTNDGGDVCDLDDDNDGMSDTFETTNGLNPFDAADAALDADGDGISNLDEFLAGTNPNFASLTINSTGYLTPFALTPPKPTVVAAGATAVVASNNGPYRPGHFDITWTASNSTSANLDTSIQSLDVRPIVSFAPDQQAAESSTVNVLASLNGSAAIYPVTVNYTVSGTADASDHNAVAGSFVITTPNQMVSFPFNVVADALSEGTETVIFTMTSATNAVLSNDVTHLVSIIEGNVAPVVSLRLSQNGKVVSKAYVSEGTVTVDAIVNDANSAQTHSLDWSRTANSLLPPTNNTTSNWTFTPAAGNYLIGLVVTDNGSPTLSNSLSQVINVSGDSVPTLKDLNGNDIDSDGDSVLDINEGFGDSDQDGIPDYLDAQSTGANDQHLIPNQTAARDNTTWFLVQTEPGIKIVTGNTARASNNSGAIVTDANIASFGGTLGGAPLNASDDFEHVGGIYDFELSGLVPGQSANIVIPLQSAIPIDAIFRKFNPNTGWSNFVVDNNNRLASAPGVLGACPETGSSQYTDGLVAFSNCLQLTIQDGGPNDADGVANGVVKDPGSLGITLQAPVTPTVRGSGRIDLVMFLGLFLLICCRAYTLHRASRR